MLKTSLKRRTGVAIGLALAFSLAGFALVAQHSGSNTKQAAGGGGLDIGGSPLAAGRQVSLEVAVTSAPFPVYRPQADLASDASIKEVWLRTEWDPEVLIQYASGIRLEVRRAAFLRGSSPDGFYKAQVAEGVPGQIVPIQGVDVFVVPGDTQGDLGSASMVVNDLWVSIVGDGDFSIDQLENLARSVLSSVTTG